MFPIRVLRPCSHSHCDRSWPYPILALSLATVLLASCGGGGTVGSASPGEPEVQAALPEEIDPNLAEARELLLDDWSVSPPFDSTGLSAKLAYLGIQDLALLTRDNSGQVITAALLGYPGGHAGPESTVDYSATDHLGLMSDILSLLQISAGSAVTELKYEYERVAGDNDIDSFELDCGTSGSVGVHIAIEGETSWQIEPTQSNGSHGRLVAIMEFNECDFYGNSLHGLVKVSNNQSGKSADKRTYAMEDVRISIDDEQVLATGVLSETLHCNDQRSTRADLLLSHVESNVQTLYEDFHWRIDDSEGTICTTQLQHYPWNAVTGSLMLSGIGKVDIDTQGELVYSINPQSASFNSYDGSDVSARLEAPTGSVKITGAEQSSLEIKTVSPRVSRGSSGQILPAVRVSLREAEAQETEKFTTSGEFFAAGILRNLADSDDDGIHDSWETHYSLSPTDPRDAQEGAQQNGLSPAEIYASNLNSQGGEPHLPSTEMSIVVDIVEQVDRETGSMLLSATVVGQNFEPRYQPVIKRFELTLEGDADWDYGGSPLGCDASVKAKSLSCEYTLGTYAQGRNKFEMSPMPIIAKGDTEITVTATLDDTANDSELSNNISSDTASYYVTLPVDYNVDVDAFAIGNMEDIRTLTATIAQQNVAGLSDVEISILPSPGVNILDADLLTTGNQPLVSRCTLDSPITCVMEDVSDLDRLSLTLDYILTDDADQFIEWNVITAANDTVLGNNKRRTSISAIQSTAVLQALIDEAKAGTTLQLPPGKYVGTLDFDYKQINLVGAQGEAPTVLQSFDLNEPILSKGGGYVTISNMVFKTTGAAIAKGFDENLSIENSLILPVDGRPHTVERLFDTASYRLLGNTIKGFGQGDANTCASIVDQKRADFGYGVSIFLERNLILDNNCDQLVYIDNSRGFVNHYLNNNTFIGNPSLIRMSSPGNSSPLYIVNNIIMDADSILDIPAIAFTETHWSGVGLYSSRNLLWNSERSAVMTGGLLARIGAEIGKTDLNEDPLLIDPDNGEYRPAFNSPVIDRGVQPSEYHWTYDDSIHEFLKPGASEKIQAIDGSLDGQVLFDIGAIEYDPDAQ